MRSLRVPTLVSTLILFAQALVLTGTAFTVDFEARIRATAAAGQTIVAAIESYRQEHGEFPVALDRLVPRYMSHVPLPPYGLKWQYDAVQWSANTDGRLAVALDGLVGPAMERTERPEFALSVQLDERYPALRFQRDNGCWHLTGSPKCW